MTEGSETGHIIRFALPLLGGNLLQQTYNIIDTLVVGRYLGDDALAAVGATGSITYLFYTLCIGLSIGAGVIVSQLFGSKDNKRMRSAVVNSAIVTAVFGIVISIISSLAAEPVLRMLNVPDKLIGSSVIYMKIACGGTAAVAAYNWINAIMRAVGDSKTPLIFLGAAIPTQQEELTKKGRFYVIYKKGKMQINSSSLFFCNISYRNFSEKEAF